MEQTTLVDNVTDAETDTRQFISDVETDTRQFESIQLWHVLVCLVIGFSNIMISKFERNGNLSFNLILSV
jgi:hypothetical protein